ncbi:MAG: penicillin-binding protein activator LpoB [Endomicrobium sp.]|jgi:PBP1b-binding outer membrane lipoprotein LpoB|nr:penicillin-binding protein activator LpoB [Endomicrobium sp.]
MKLKRIVAYSAVGLLLALFCSCVPKVTRVESDEGVDLSGFWNDTDSQQVAQKMIGDAFADQWIMEFIETSGRKPRLIIGPVLNKTEEHISTETFVKDLEKYLITSRKVVFVASKGQRAEIRSERSDQAINAKIGTAKSHGMELGADFMLHGQINSILDANKKAQLKYYQVELEVIDLESNRIVWMGQEKIKKVISRRRYKA